MDGIEFGKIEHRGPESAVRPDRNRKYAVVASGKIDQQQLPIFVDLDVMRDMEGHARTNTHVELGGVLLGGKYVDEDGKFFVVIFEALRAEHYEATRGSFKFTHDTWSQITRDRETFPEDLHLVGWYHTHPDWGVFLSGMDTFICDNFFGDELDVDLVIDPCRGDRGWFFWDSVGGARKKTRLTGFYLFSNRYRRSELLHFAQAMSEENPAYFDPRYENPIGETNVQPIVNIHDQKSPVLMVAVMGMLTIQMLVLGLVAWRLLFPPAAPTAYEQQQRNEIYREILGAIASADGDENAGVNLISRVEMLAQTAIEMDKDIKGRDLLIDSLEQERKAAEKQVEKLGKSNDDNEKQLAELKRSLDDEKKLNKEIKEKRSPGLNWIWVAAIGVGTALLGLISGAFLGRNLAEDNFDEYQSQPKPEPLKSEMPGEFDDQADSGMTFGDSASDD